MSLTLTAMLLAGCVHRTTRRATTQTGGRLATWSMAMTLTLIIEGFGLMWDSTGIGSGRQALGEQVPQLQAGQLLTHGKQHGRQDRPENMLYICNSVLFTALS